MTIGEYPDPQPGRPLWLITLADLALLLVGFFVLIQATQHAGSRRLDARDLAEGIREGFGAGNAPRGVPRPASSSAVPPALPVTSPGTSPALPVAATGVLDFAVGSAAMPESPDALLAWAREAVQDPRVQLTVTGSVDGSAADVDAATGSAAILASDRARTVAVALARVAPRRVTLAQTPSPGRRAAMVTLAFVGEPPRIQP